MRSRPALQNASSCFVLFALLLFPTSLPAKGAVIFLEPGYEATENFVFYTSTVGQNVNFTGASHTGPYNIQCFPSAGNQGYVTKSGILSDSGRRISIWVRISAYP